MCKVTKTNFINQRGQKNSFMTNPYSLLKPKNSSSRIRARGSLDVKLFEATTKPKKERTNFKTNSVYEKLKVPEMPKHLGAVMYRYSMTWN